MKGIGIFLIHGITKTPKEFERISFILNKKRIKTYCPLLPGHGTGKNGETYFQDFWLSDQKEWLVHAEKEFIKFKKGCKEVYIGGVSLGGNIALKLALKYKVNGLILIGVPIFLSRILTLAYSAGRIALKIKNTNNNFHGLPIKKMLEIKDFLIDETKKELSKVECPVIIFQSRKDDITNPKSALYIFKRIKSKDKKIIWFNNAGHRIDTNYKKYSEIIAKEILQFINK